LLAFTSDELSDPYSLLSWGYLGAIGPGYWGGLSGYKLCGTSKSQSPIDIVVDGAEFNNLLTPLKWDVHNTLSKCPGGKSIISNSGQGIQVDGLRAELTFNETKFCLQQIQFHTHSEHSINDKFFPMEMQMLHTSLTGDKLVVSLMLQGGGKAGSDLMSTIGNNLPKKAGQSKPGPTQAQLFQFHQSINSEHYFYYNGSLTAPPCTEDVLWIVLGVPFKTGAPIAKFKKLMKNNARPIQPLQQREVQKSWADPEIGLPNYPPPLLYKKKAPK